MRNPLAGRSPRTIAMIAGVVVCAFMVLFVDLQPDKPAVTYTAAVAVLMAVWWLSEAVPLAVTAMLPVVLLPVLGVMDGKEIASKYFNQHTFLFLGGFMVALAMERWNLHKRIALRTLLMFGVHPTRILLGFMVATAFLSMWISNTASTMMMVTIAVAMLAKLEDSAGREAVAPLAVGLMLGVAYSASVGGLATLVGTPTNMAFVGIFEGTFKDGPSISFATWMVFALPVAVCMLLITWWYLCRMYVRGKTGELPIDGEMLRNEYDALGPMSFAERVVLVDFVLLALLWISRQGWAGLLPVPGYVNDGTVAMVMATVLFLIPSERGSKTRIMDWETATRLPWGIVLLFGGGFALAAAFKQSGLSDWLGGQLMGTGWLWPIALLALACLTITFLTELTSNVATNQMILPVLASLAPNIGLNPLLLMVPVTLCCSCAFMMPVATPPNAIVFGTGRIRIADMARTGLALNFIGVLVVVLSMYLYGRWVWGIDFGQLPEWAGTKNG